MTSGHLFEPLAARDPHYADTTLSPVAAIRLDFPDAGSLERCLVPGGHLSCLLDDQFLPSLHGSTLRYEAMLRREFAVADPVVGSADGTMVIYEGPAKSEGQWHQAYVRSHVPLLAKASGRRLVEVYTPAVVICGLPIGSRRSLQRNKSAYDTESDLANAMKSSLRARMREDFARLPAFEGAVHHFPFRVTSVRSGEQLSTA